MSRWGTPSERFWANVAKTDRCWLWQASATNAGYGQMYVNGKNYLAHRLSYTFHFGPIPKGKEIDHICHVRVCVNPAHLRIASRKQNSENHLGAQSNSKSGVRGVYLRSDTKRWSAEVRHNGIKHSLGCFSTMAEAEEAAVAARRELFTHNDYDRATA